MLCAHSIVSDSVTVAHQAPLSMEFFTRTGEPLDRLFSVSLEATS